MTKIRANPVGIRTNIYEISSILKKIQMLLYWDTMGVAEGIICCYNRQV